MRCQNRKPDVLAVVEEAPELVGLLFELGHLDLELQILALQYGGTQRNVVLFGAARVPRTLGRLVVLAAPLPVRLVLVRSLGHLVNVDGEGAGQHAAATRRRVARHGRFLR